jgi:hypothetical protein
VNTNRQNPARRGRMPGAIDVANIGREVLDEPLFSFLDSAHTVGLDAITLYWV